MEIQNKHIHTNLFKKIYKKNKKNRLIKFGALVTFFLVLSFGFIIYGAYLNKTAQTSNLRMFLSRLSDLDFSFVKNKMEGEIAVVDNFSIDVKFKNWEKIRYNREIALENEIISPDVQNEVPAKLVYNDETYRVDISITGLTTLHLIHPYKWSLSIKVKDGKTIKGMKKFALLFPQSRGYLTDWIASEMLKSQEVIGLRNGFVNLSINGDDNGIYYIEERFDKRLLENNQFKEGIIFKHRYNELKIYGLKNILENKQLSAQLINLKKLLHGFQTGDIEVDKLFDLNKFASLVVVSDIIGLKHALFRSNMRLYFNPVTGLIEPIGREWGYLRKETKYTTSLLIEKPNPIVTYHSTIQNDDFLSKIYSSLEFEEEYIKKAKILSNEMFLDSLVSINQTKIDQLLNEIHKYNPFYIFPIDLLKVNQKYIRDKIYTKLPDINAFFNNSNDGSFSLAIENLRDLPIEIHYISYNIREQIFPKGRMILASKYKQDQIYQEKKFHIPRSINQADFSPDSLEVIYSILGINETKKIAVFSKKLEANDYSNLNPTRRSSNLADFPFLTVDETNKTILFSVEKCNIDKDLIIPKGYIVSAIPGCQIDITNSSKIISYSPLRFFGKRDNIISIGSSDLTGQGLVVFNCNQYSELSFVEFSNLSNISEKGWSLSAAVTFYEAPVNIINSTFRNNLIGDDYLNVIRTNFNLIDSKFENTNADALDSDFCNGNIENVQFLEVGNDAIDISGTKLNISEVEIVNANDKGISGGENSHIIGRNITVRGGEIAIASKDNTNIELDNIKIESSKLAYCAFQKKSEFGPGIIKIINGTLMNVDTPYLIEIGSEVWIDGKEIENKSKKVKEILYGVEFGKSSK